MKRILVITAMIVLGTMIVAAQTTAFTYQGSLNSGSGVANGNHDFEFLLFDAGGTQVGSTITQSGVAVTNGIFAVSLDFGSLFPGAPRFLEIHVRVSGVGAFTTLSPRQPLTTAPYSVKSLAADNAANATNATNAVTATNFTGNLSGDVIGTQGVTVVNTVGGQSAATVANAVLSVNAAAANNTPNALVKRDASGNFIAGTITGNLNGNASTATNATNATNSTNAENALNATSAATATNALSLGGIVASQYLQTNGNGSGLTNLNAGSIATGTLSNSRLGLIPTANIADGAVTAPKIASGQVVKSFNTLKDDVTLAAGSNITITPAGNTLTIASTSGGVGGSGTTGSVPLWSAGATLGNSAITQNVNGVQLPNGVQLAPGAQGNNIAFGSPSGETGMTIAGASARADIRFDGTLKLLNGPAGSPPPATNGIAINTAGNVGIGTAAPSLINGGSGRFASISDSTNPGLALTNTSARQFFMYSAGGSGSFRVFDATSNADRLTLDSTGNFGIGTTTPAHRLSLIGGPLWTSNQFTGALELGNAAAIGWRANAAGNRFGIGQTTGGLTFFATLSDPGTTVSPANYVMTITDTGNITQPINNNGLVKAMLYVQANGTILRCYNGLTGATTGNCGFNVLANACIISFCYSITFPFQVDTRFISLTVRTPEDANVGVGFRPFDSTSLIVKTYIVGGSSGGAAADFTLIVY